MQTRKWQDNSGNDRYTTEIVADQMQMLDSRGGSSANFSGESKSAPAMAPAPAAAAAGGDFDDDIPF